MAAHLAVSFLYGNFNAIVHDGRQVVASWTPGAGDRSHGWHEGAFRFYLERALEETGYEGDTVSLVVADVDMEHIHLSVPPVKPKLRLQLIGKEVERRVEGSRQVWCHRYLGAYRTRPTRPAEEEETGLHGSEHYLVHLWPQNKLRQYLQDMRAVGLTPRLILPIASLMLQWADEESGLDDIVCLVNHTPNGTTMLVRNRQGPEVLLRHLTPGGGTGRTRLVEEIQRSVLYARQNLGIAAREVHVGGGDMVADVAARLQGDANVVPAARWEDVTFPAVRVATLPAGSTESLVPASIRHERRNRIINRVGNYAVATLGVAALVTVAAVEWYLRRTEQGAQATESRYELRVAEQQRLETEIQNLEGRQQFLEWALHHRQPVMTWFVHDLGRLTPPPVRLTEVSVGPPLDGLAPLRIKASLTVSDLESAERSLQVLGTGLSTAPWFADLPDDWMRLWRQQYLRGEINPQGQALDLEIAGDLPW